MRTTRSQVAGAVVVGLATGTALTQVTDVSLGVMAGIMLGEVTFLVLSFMTLWPMDPEETAANVAREDLAPMADEVLVALVSALAMISMVALNLGESKDTNHAVGALFTLFGVFGAWACVHQTYAVHYAYQYYLRTDGGIDFKSPEKPSFVDFLYLSYAVGMTYGVTDNDVKSRAIRKIVLRHAVISFVFGMVILGAGVNLVAGVVGLND